MTHVGGGGGRGFGNQLSIGRGRPTQNSYRLDGDIVNDYSNAGPGSVLGANLGVDAIQEFTVLTSNYSAEYGFTSGRAINAITKAGASTLHGTAFDFLRNDAPTEKGGPEPMKPLPFTPEDIDLIHRGLAARAARAASVR